LRRDENEKSHQSHQGLISNQIKKYPKLLHILPNEWRGEEEETRCISKRH